MRTVGLLVSIGLFAPPGQVFNFDAFSPGDTPPGWTVAMSHQGRAPRWEVIKDTTAPSPPYVFGQTSNHQDQDRCPLALLEKPRFRDGELSVRVKPVAGREDQAGGLVWRYRDPNNYYLVRANALEKNVAAYKMHNGRLIPLVPAVPHKIASNGWLILKVAFRKNAYAVYVNHRRILQGVDPTFGAPGQVGLWTQADSVTYFDDFRVNPR